MFLNMALPVAKNVADALTTARNDNADSTTTSVILADRLRRD